jgi:DNA repair photolyase
MLITKSALILRDLDLLAPMAEKGLVSVAISFTSLDRQLSRTMEPRCAAPHRRLDAMRELSSAGIPVTAMTAPLIPALNEPELEHLLEAAADAGARRAGYVLLRLPLEIAGLFTEWLEAHYPDRAKRVMSLLRGMHNGQDYRSEWKVRQRGEGPYAQLIAARFRNATRRLGLNADRTALRTDLFRAPPARDSGSQGDLFGGQG